ncbi:MAG: hypothetical protein JWO32_2563, partial [Bacteroidetes bacterium]|nr:hypothetical protein [Bacteroidota bacterium]
ESFYGIDATTDGGYVSVGSTNSFGSLNGDVFLIKQDSSINSYQSVVGFADLKKVGEKVLLKNYGNVYEIQLLSEEYEEIVLTNIFGELIYKRLITGKNELISLNELPAGTYILNLRSKYTKSATFKLINI